MKFFVFLIGIVCSRWSQVETIGIEGQLTVIRNDCYERLAIGERLNPKKVYKVFDYNNVAECEMECTKDKQTCRAFSIGIGLKGNGTCELSSEPVRETADLKPIGTVSDTDFDLYIKKLDCQLVIENPHFNKNHNKLATPIHDDTEHYPGVEHTQTATAYQQNAVHYGYDYPKPASINHPPNYDRNKDYSLQNDPKHGYAYPKPSHMPQKPYGSNHKPSNDGNANIHQVQTMVSIASGPNSYLHPVHDIILSNDQQSGVENGNIGQYHEIHRNARPYTSSQNNGGIPHPNKIPSYTKPRPSRRPDYELPNGGGSHHQQHGDTYGGHISGPYKGSIHNKPYFPENFHDNSNPNYGSSNYPQMGQHDYWAEASNYGGGQEYYGGGQKYYGGGYAYEKPLLAPYPALDQDRPDPHPQYGERNPFHIHNPGSSYEYQSNGGGTQYLAVNRRKYDSFEEESHNRFAGFPPRKYPPNRNFYDHYEKPFPDWPTRYGSLIPHPNDYDNNNHQYYDKTQYYDYLFKPSLGNKYEIDFKLMKDNRNKENHTTPTTADGTTDAMKEENNELASSSDSQIKNGKLDTKKNGFENQNSIVTHRVGEKGQQITSIITVIEKACFRRAFAGKRIIRGLVRKLVLCDTVEQCQQECADQNSFTCEGFNYRIDPSGRGKGECELLDLPLSRINIPRDLIIDDDYDVYIRDRNAAAVNCRQPPSGSQLYPGNFEDDWDYSGSHHYADSFEYEEQFDRRGTRPYGPLPPLTPLPAPPPSPARRPPPRPNDLDPVLRRPADRWQEDGYIVGPKPRPVDYPEPAHHRPSGPVDGYLISGPRPGPEIDRRHDYGAGEYYNHHTLHESHRNHENSHRFHYNYHNIDQQHEFHESGHTPGIHYLPVSRPLEPYLPLERPPSKPDTWGLNRKHWGSYGGSYGNFGDRNTYYGNNNKYRDQNRYEVDRRITYLPVPPPPKDWGLYGGSYGSGGASLQYQGFGDQHSYKYWGFHKNQESNDGNDRDFIAIKRPFYLPIKPIVQELDNFILPAEPRRPGPYKFIKDECSLRMAPGFRLHKRIVKKYYAVPNIYECELLCFKENDFICSAYAFRYTVSLNSPTDNCYLSERNFKELDYYTDLEPDRDSDIYTINNREKCHEPLIMREKHHSECFWRVRSGQRLDHTVVRDSLKVNSIVECQLECLRSKRFTCRAYSFRYGSPIIGGIIDNCQLTNWPFYELDPQRHFITEPGFEVYERGSFGHGCQPDHFRISGRHIDQKVKVDTVCYIGFAQAARLLPSATIKSLFVPTELDCKNECSKLRQRSPLRCMTFSFRSSGSAIQSNCYLSHIIQRDLLPKVDYIEDPTSWLFTWDNYNPECIDVYDKKKQQDHFPEDRERESPDFGRTYDLDFFNPQETWRVYSVSGWPCRRGTTCNENVEAGFWFCYLEGEDKTAWDYCCRPDHQCGLSQDYPYEWCYVGPERTQWRKCSDRYYPYFHYNIDRFEQVQPPKPWNQNTGYLKPPPFRPDRPPADPTVAPPRPSLDEYENQFDDQFLSPPKPGGFGIPRRWPISYLHKDKPFNSTEPESRSAKKEDKNSKILAIKNLIDVIKNNDFKNVEYHITNNSNKPDDVLFVKIPLPANLTTTTDKQQETTSKRPELKIKSSNKRAQKSITQQEWTGNAFDNTNQQYRNTVSTTKTARTQQSTPQEPDWRDRLVQRDSTQGYRKGYVVRTNVTRTRRWDQAFL